MLAYWKTRAIKAEARLKFLEDKMKSMIEGEPAPAKKAPKKKTSKKTVKKKAS